jgi:hypothetical protein
MARLQFNRRVPKRTIERIQELATEMETTDTQVFIDAIDHFYEERRELVLQQTTREARQEHDK